MKNNRPLKKIISYCWPLVLFILVGSGYYKNADAVHGAVRKGFSVNVPVTLNKTHFIVGLSARPVAQNNQASGDYVPSPEQCSTDNHAYFSPDDDLQQKLIDLIDQEQEEIQLAIYTFTNKHIAHAFERAHQRGVRIEIVADPSFLSDRFTKIGDLQDLGVVVHIYNPQGSHHHGRKKSLANLMHNKFVVFKRNAENRPCIWTGSFNFTNSAHLSNQENVVILNDIEIVQRYDQQFKELKKRSMLYQPQ